MRPRDVPPAAAADTSLPPRPGRRRVLHAAAAAPVLLLGLRAGAQEGTPVDLDVPYVPTPQPVVDAMLNLASVGPGDVVYDLGCGDGRVVISAARRGARGVGIDLDPQRISEANANARAAGMTQRVTFQVGDLFEADFSPASVVTLYLLPDVNRKLRPRLWRQLKVGTRVVSHDFDMGPAWPPERSLKVGNKTLHYWTITPAHKTAVGLAPASDRQPGRKA